MNFKEVTLSSAVKDVKKASFISKERIALAYCEISIIDRLPYPYNKVAKLHLSHNKIISLDGIEQFQGLEQLSLSYNRIEQLQEFYKVNNRYKLKEISVRGNPIEHHPNHTYFIAETFPAVQRIDDLIIESSDRQFLTNFERISALIIPFYLTLQQDLETLIKHQARLSSMQGLKERNSHVDNVSGRHDDSSTLLAEQMMSEVKQELSHPNLLDRLSNYYSQKKSMYMTSGFVEKKPIAILANLVDLINTLYPNFSHFKEQKADTLYDAFRFLFNEIMIQYHGNHDKSLDMFLTNKVLESRNYDLERFSNDSMYAFECIMLEFYKLMPSQAFLTEDLSAGNYEFPNEETAGDWQLGTEGSQSTKRNILNTEMHDPEYLKTLWLSHFPVFPMNKQYLTSLSSVLRNKVGHVYAAYNESEEMLKELRGEVDANRASFTLSSRRTQNQGSISPSERTMAQGDYVDPTGDSHYNREGQDKQSTLRPDQTISHAGYSTRDSVFYDRSDALRNATTERHIQEASEEEEPEEHNRTQQLPANRSILPILVLVRVSDKLQASKHDALATLKSYRIDPAVLFYNRLDQDNRLRLMRSLNTFADAFRKSSFRRFKARVDRLNDIQEFLSRQEHLKQSRAFRAFFVAKSSDLRKADIIHSKNLYLKSTYSILKVIASKRAVLKKLLTRLDSRLSTTLSFNLAKWKMVARASSYLTRHTVKPPRWPFKQQDTSYNSMEGERRSEVVREDNPRRQYPYTQRPSRMSELQAFTQMYAGRHEPEQHLGTFRNNVFRKCFACDAPGFH